MRAYSRWIALLLLGVVVPAVSLAQEAKPTEPAKAAEAPKAPEPVKPAEASKAAEADAQAGDEGKRVYWFVEASDWVSQPEGLEYAPASQRDTNGGTVTSLASMPQGTENRIRYRAGFSIHKNVGEVVGTWYSHAQNSELARYTPGQFAYGILPMYPLYAGINDDGLADGFLAETQTKLRDMRLDFRRIGFQSSKIVARWFVGYRMVQHTRTLDGEYYSLFPVYQGQALPPILFPQPTPNNNPLAAGADTAHLASQFEGGGLEAGVDLTFPLSRSLSIETGFSIASLQGRLATQYGSTSHFYAMMSMPSRLEIDYIMAPPFDEFNSVDAQGNSLIGAIQQFALPINVETDDSAGAQILESYLELRWKAWRGLEVFGGYRSARYTGVGADVKPGQINWYRDPNTKVITVTVPSFTREDHSVNYQGLYGGVSYKY
jgi:hypothetical protein